MKIRNIVIATALGLSLAACDMPQDPRQQEEAAQEKLTAAAQNTLGLPNIVNFQEKRVLKDIIEMRDAANLRTFTYTLDVNGSLHKLCDSVGYGIPYSTQYTNPQQIADSYQSGYAIIPQADPNGLYSPASADGTWVLCKDPNGDKVAPVFIEPTIIVSQFPLG